MNLDRKTFLRKGILSLGEMILHPGRLVAEPEEKVPIRPPGLAGETARPGLAVPDNGQCLAQRGGCFTCLEQCPREAIAIEPGMGIRVDPEKCDGCGLCEHICPLSPSAIRLARLSIAQSP